MSRLHPDLDFKMNHENMIQTGQYRLTLLTRHCFRLEIAPNTLFTDEPSLNVISRHTDRVSFTKTLTKENLVIENEIFILSFNPLLDPKNNLKVSVKGYPKPYLYGQKTGHNLLGTARTLDQVNGELKLNDGYFSEDGYVILDDSQTPLFQPDGSIKARLNKNTDMIFIASRNDFKEVHSEMVRFMGVVPKFPRYVLGNWWSKYWNYTDQQLLDTVDQFGKMNIPLSVCIIDMDWHLTEVENQNYWYGWTGYTVNPKYFPDFEGFIKQLHQRKLKTSVNLHPALGIRPHEIQYKEFCAWMGIDPSSKVTIPFQIEDPHFAEGYFKILHHPYEEKGVDFWWIDWQQGTKTSMVGVDPLFVLNHRHALDFARDTNKRPFTFSRWTQFGGHRYPIGFSGDTVSTWESLAFQPYFTATAANVNFSWWSHDIGGHFKGLEEPELLTRWVQFGCFSPILRLHSSRNEMCIREPWLLVEPFKSAIADAMRLRMRLVPYLYTGLHQNSVKGVPFLTPLYYEFPKDPQAYKARNNYFLGRSLLVAPVISPMIKTLNRSVTKVYLPEGIWIDYNTALEYNGRRWIDVYSDIQSIPLFVRQDSIIPLSKWEDSEDPVGNPTTLIIKVFASEHAEYTLIEDDNETIAYQKKEFFCTELNYKDKVFTIKTDKKTKPYLPFLRNYEIEIVGLHVKGDFKAIYTETSTLIALSGMDITANISLKFSSIEKVDQKFLLRKQLKLGLANALASVDVKADLLSAFDNATLNSAYRKHKKEKELVAMVKALMAAANLLS
ncbi:MAG: Alpha-glucosidase family 31 of glycosyl hydrolase [Erysipelotrichaceae bacterium]|nr:MAG: Alpha-glucosidase family 31 of glycosyl [Erysipelotrichaceae bacterium]TXT17459.1 MAG: Alpha-glucosidase family 31 of glycosyl hydrolase [Erysipelotrichaceae bacterium]